MRRMVLAGVLALALALGAAACGDGGGDTTGGGATTEADSGGGGAIASNPENEGISLTIGSKNFPEQEILGEIYAQGLAAAGYDVSSDLNLGSETVARKAVKTGAISGYPEYASTALTSFFGLEPEEVPAGATEAWEKADEEFEKEGLVAFEPTPFVSANAVGTLKKTAEERDLKTVSDLEGQSEEMTLYGSPECRQRIDCLAGLEQLYGLTFKSFTPVDIGLRYTVLEKGQADLSILFTTDPQLAAEDSEFVILEDDKEVFPAGNVIFVTTPEVVEEAGPDYEATILQVQEGLTLEVMQELDAGRSGLRLPRIGRLHRLAIPGRRSRQGFHLTFSVRAQRLSAGRAAEKVQDVSPLPGPPPKCVRYIRAAQAAARPAIAARRRAARGS
jgi:osmoprotectant transport system substrate-binding protein